MTALVPSKVSIRTEMVTPNNWFVSCSRLIRKTTVVLYTSILRYVYSIYSMLRDEWSIKHTGANIMTMNVLIKGLCIII